MLEPNKIIEVDKLVEEKQLTNYKVLLSVDGDQVKLGRPYLDQPLDIKVIENIRKPKIRVATYKSKANYRKVKGFRREVTKVKLNG